MNSLYFLMGFLVGIVSGFVIWIWVVHRIAKEIMKSTENPERRT